MKNILMIHYGIPEYRVQFFQELGKLCNLTLVLFNQQSVKKIYDDDDRSNSLSNVKVIESYSNQLVDELIYRSDFDGIILPPLDDIKSLKITYRYSSKKYKIKKYIFWGFWEPEKLKGTLYKKFKKKIQRYLRIYIMKRIDRILCYSSISKKYLQFLGVPEEKISVFYNSSVVTNQNPSINIREYFKIKEKYIYLYLGRLVENKGAMIMLEAFYEANIEDACLLIAGTGELQNKLQKFCREEGIENVYFSGYVKPEDRESYYKIADVFVLPSYIYNNYPEPWGLSINEALTYKIPVVTTDAVGAAFDLIDETNGIICHENNINDLKRGLIKALKIDRNRMTKLKYTPETMASNVEKSIY